MMLNSIRMHNLKYRDEYGQLVICCDAGTWRRDVFPEYKASRKTDRAASPVDWDAVFDIINTVRDRDPRCVPVSSCPACRC